MFFFGKHEVIGDTNGDGAREDDRKDEERIHTTNTSNVEVHIDTAIMMKDKIADGVRPLDGIGVRIKGVEKPMIMLRNELARACVCP